MSMASSASGSSAAWIVLAAGDYDVMTAGQQQNYNESLIPWSNSSSLTITSASGARVVLDGLQPLMEQQGSQPGAFLAVGSGATVNLIGVTVAGGGWQSGTISNEGTLNVLDSTFEDDYSGSGGAIQNYGVLTVSESTFANDFALSGDGGAISNSGKLTIINSTFAGNGTTGGKLGADIASTGSAGVAGSIFNDTCDGSITDGGYNAVATTSGTGCAGNSATDVVTQYLGNVPFGAAGAALSALSNNGGETDTMIPIAPQSGASITLAGRIPPDTAAALAGGEQLCPITDQRDIPSGGANCAIGSVGSPVGATGN